MGDIPHSTSYEFLAKVISTYRYGQETPPEDITSEEIVNNAGQKRPALHVSLNDFMAGPGRFARPPMSKLVLYFFNWSTNLAPGEYSKSDLASILGLSSYGINYQQIFYRDSINDYRERSMIWNSTKVKLGDDVKFVVEENGNKYIKNLYMVNNGNDNFDFESNSIIAKLVNPELKNLYDFSNIGAKVELVVDGDDAQVDKTPIYDELDFSNDFFGRAGNIAAAIGGVRDVWGELSTLYTKLWNDGIIKQEDKDGRAILYGSTGDDSINVKSLTFRVKLMLNKNLYKASFNGFHIIGGQGDDDLQGGSHGDLIRGGAGNDKIAGRKGDDILVGNDGKDFITGGAGKDTLYGGSGKDYLDGGEGDDRLFGNDGDDHLVGGEGNDDLYGGDGMDTLDGGAGNDLIVAVSESGGGAGQLQGGEGADTFVVGSGYWLIPDAEAEDRLYVQVPTGENVSIPILGGYLFYYFWDDTPEGLTPEQPAEFAPYSFSGDGAMNLVGNYEYDIVYILSEEGSLIINIYNVPNYGQPYYDYSYGDPYASILIPNYRQGVLGLNFIDCLNPFEPHDGIEEPMREGQATVNSTLSNFMGNSLQFSYGEEYQHEPSPSGWKGGSGNGSGGGDSGSGGGSGTDSGNSGDEWANPDKAPSDDDDRLKGTHEDDTIDGGDGHDKIRGEGGNDNLQGGKGHDQLDGGPGDDWLDGGFGWDLLKGGEGNDTLKGGGNDDLLQGDSGSDDLDGENGQDILEGGGGNDKLQGGADEDTLDGGDGDDRLFGGTQDDTLSGGSGSDILYGDSGNDMLYGDDGEDTLFGGVNDDHLFGGAGADYLYGGGQSDFLMGEEGNDTLFGDAGDDYLYGNAGDDYLDGGMNNDVLIGGPGNDTLKGGRQQDVFVYAPGYGTDTIADFQNNVDKLDLSAYGFASPMELAPHVMAINGGLKITFDPQAHDALIIEGMTWLTLQNDLILDVPVVS